MHTPLSNYLFQEELYRFSSPVIVVLARSWESYTDDERVLLQKIAGSVKLDLSSAQVITAPSVDLASLKVFAPARVLLFGAEVSDEIELYQAASAHGFNVIRAEDLNVLDDQKKKNLWIALRQMFQI